MSVVLSSPRELRLGEDDHDFGWVAFAAIVLLILGCMNTIEGVAAVTGSDFFTTRAEFVFGDLSSLGWAIWLIGIAQGLTGVAVLSANQFARWLGVGIAALNLTVQILMMQAYPLWSLGLLGLDILVMYGLAVHGGRSYRPV